MRLATKKDLKLVTSILHKSFTGNQSIDYVVKQDKYKVRRQLWLMKYSFKKTLLYGEIFISDNNKACLLMKKENSVEKISIITSIKSFILDIKLVFKAIGISSISKILKRERALKKLQPKESFLHLWMVGVEPEFQGNGHGSAIIKEALSYYSDKRLCYLETSNPRNLALYKRLGFVNKGKLALDYPLYVMEKKF